MLDIDLIDFSCLCCESEGELLGMSGGSALFPEIQMVSVHYSTSSALSLLPLGRTCFCLTLPGFRDPITMGLSVIPVLLVVLAGSCGREEAQHSLWLGCLSYKTPVPLIQHNQLLQEKSSKGHLLSVPGMLPGVLAVLGTIQQPSAARCALRVTGRCFLGTAACSWWSPGTGSV